eukprot:1147929-Pelagomonas_calceolata.AAC.6
MVARGEGGARGRLVEKHTHIYTRTHIHTGCVQHPSLGPGAHQQRKAAASKRDAGRGDTEAAGGVRQALFRTRAAGVCPPRACMSEAGRGDAEAAGGAWQALSCARAADVCPPRACMSDAGFGDSGAAGGVKQALFRACAAGAHLLLYSSIQPTLIGKPVALSVSAPLLHGNKIHRASRCHWGAWTPACLGPGCAAW